MADERSAATVHPIEGFHAVIPAGGSGTRLWPLSRAGRPKFLLDLTGSPASAETKQAVKDRMGGRVRL